MAGVALTDSHNLFGAIEFYTTAKAAGLKPIIGCDVSCSPFFHRAEDAQLNQYRLTVLCKDLNAYKNLCLLISESYRKFNPEVKGARVGVDRDLLDRYGDGLVILSGGLKGELAFHLLNHNEDAAKECFDWFKKRFGDDYYLELQDNGLPEQEYVNEILHSWVEKHGAKTVATAPVHYLAPEDAESHEVLQCIEEGKNLDFERPKSLVPSEFYFKTQDEMAERFERFEGAFERTIEIFEKCNVEFRFKDENGRTIYHLPNFRPDGVSKSDEFDPIAYFRDQGRKGLERRFTEPQFIEKKKQPHWPEVEKAYRDRLEDELKMIEKTGFSGYFLIVADFINWAKGHEIPVGPGRGSGAGSIVAYSLRITDCDPIEFNLLFERFINPERISMPDFDVDFCQDRRGEVIDYVTRKYGVDNVCQIITFGKLQARAAIKDVGRVLGLSFAETDQLTKLLPEELNITISSSLEREPRLKEKMAEDPKLAKVIEYALKLEGLARNAGVHAAGVIITEEPITTYCPLYVGRDGVITTQFDKDFAEQIGLVKYDFLGLKTLTVIDNAVKLLKRRGETEAERTFELSAINYRDPEVFALISSGDTDGVFQVESSGMKDLCQRIIPSSLEDITAINALYRPGPLGSGMVDDFIDRKHGRKPITYDVPKLESILKDTYGVILYQEQVMQIARELAGYSLGQADLLRRAMGKKKPEEMAKHKEIFVSGAAKQGLPQEKSSAIFDLMAKFAEYGFNKSHSAAYGLITYQTAYLKRYYPAEFMAALMTTEMDNTDKLAKYVADARAHGIKVLPPDVNVSERRFSVEKLQSGEKAIRFGLEAIKGVGGVAVDVMIEARNERPFDSVLDFARRVSTRKVNKKVLESLVFAGAFDSIAEVNRPSLYASIESLLSHAADEQEERELGQSSLFDSFQAQEVKLASPTGAIFKNEPDWSLTKRLAFERQVVGFYVSGHPMDVWQKVCEEWLGTNTERLKKQGEVRRASPQAQAPSYGPGAYGPNAGPKKPVVRLAGLIVEVKEITTKKGSRMAFAQIEDCYGRVEAIFFPEAYTASQEALKRAATEGESVIVTGEFEATDEAIKILARSIEMTAEANQERVKSVVLKINPSQVQADQLRALKQRLIKHQGRYPVKIEFRDATFSTTLDLPKNIRVSGSAEMIREVNELFGGAVVSLQ